MLIERVNKEDFDAAVRGWKQALGVIQAQAIALDWCVAQFGSLKSEGLLPQSEGAAREYYDVVLSARNTGLDYLAAMRDAGGIK